MEGYLTPSIEEAIALVQTSCDELTKQQLIHYIGEITAEFIEGDPELADIILEGGKSVEACLRYVLNEAAYIVEKQLSAMSDNERELLPQRKIQNKNAVMAGGVVGKDSVKEWVDNYYYKTEDLDPVGTKIEEEKKKTEEKTKKAKDDARKAKKNNQQTGKEAGSISAKEIPPENDTQISLFSA